MPSIQPIVKLPRVLLLSGGLGLRLRSAVSDVPKPMAPIDGRPFLEWLMVYLASQGFLNFGILAGYKGQMIADHFGDGSSWGMQVQTLVEEKPLGTGGALRAALNQFDDDSFLVVNGDSFLRGDYHWFVRHSRGPCTVATRVTSDFARYSAIEVDTAGRVTAFREKQKPGSKMGLMNAGLYFLSRDILSEIPEGASSLESVVFPRLAEKGDLYSVLMEGLFVDIGIPESYTWAQKHLPEWFD